MLEDARGGACTLVSTILRAIIWIGAFVPTIVFFFIDHGESSAGLATALAIVQGPVLIGAALLEASVLRIRGKPVASGSRVGNKMAIILGFVLSAVVILEIYAVAARPNRRSSPHAHLSDSQSAMRFVRGSFFCVRAAG
jgi:hypothetical protein